MSPAAAHESPSLLRASNNGHAEPPPAFEIKFLVSEEAARAIELWARGADGAAGFGMQFDPHGLASLGGAYRVTSLCFDTPELDVYHRSDSYRRRKYRIRRYGAEHATFLERKSKRGDRVSKRRVCVPEDQIALLAAETSPADWTGRWFHERLALRRLQPACWVSYERTALVGRCAEGPLRLTLDRRIFGWLASPAALRERLACGAIELGGIGQAGPEPSVQPLLAGWVVLELKFLGAMPRPFKQLVQDWRLNPAAVSKYRACREAFDRTLAGNTAAATGSAAATAVNGTAPHATLADRDVRQR